MRKLATASVAFSAAVFFANYIISTERLVLLAVIFAVSGGALLLLRRKWLRPAAMVFLFVALGFVYFRVHSFNTVEKVENYDGQIHRVSAQILDYPEIYEDYCRLEVKVNSPYLPNLKAYLYDNDKQLENALPGDSVSLRAKLNSADTVYGQEDKSYHAKGIYLKLSSKGVAELERGGFDIFMLPKYLSHWLSSRIESIFTDDTEVFMRSLMLGDKTDFYGDEKLYVSMSRAGLMHIVAVSGMHVSYLVSLLYHILGKGRRSALICIVLVWLFAFVAGAGPSIVRASFMCTTMLLAPVLRRENDAVTSLSAVLAVLLLINPHAAASISLQLSFGAMAGIVLLGGRLYKFMADKVKNFIKFSVLRGVLLNISNSLSVLAFTVPLTALHFGTVPLLAPITNLVSLWAVSLCFCGGWISCALSALPFLGEASAWICSCFARYIIFAAEIISSVPYAALYAQTKWMWLWLGTSYALFFIFAFFRLGAALSYMLTVLMSSLLVVLIFFANSRYYADREMLTVLDVGQGQCITLMTDEVTAVLDCGNMYTIDDAGTEAAAYLYSHGRDCVDFLLLSHMHADHANGAVMLMETIDVGTLILPADSDDSDRLYYEVITSAWENDVEIIRLREDKRLCLGDVEIEVYRSGDGREVNERCLISRVSAGGIETLVLADATKKMQRELCEKQNLSTVDALVVSHHGSRYSVCEELLEEIGANTAVISVGFNYYGHPDEETLEALNRYGYNVYRTDTDGNVELIIG